MSKAMFNGSVQRLGQFQSAPISPLILARPKGFERLFVLFFAFSMLLLASSCERTSSTPRSDKDKTQHQENEGVWAAQSTEALLTKEVVESDITTVALAQKDDLLAQGIKDATPPTDLNVQDIGAFDGVFVEFPFVASAFLARLPPPSKPSDIAASQRPADDKQGEGDLNSKVFPEIRLRPVEVGGSRMPIVERIFRQRSTEIKACYEGEAAKGIVLDGQCIVTFRFDSDGVVSESRVISTTLNHKGVEDCMTNAIASWRFPADRYLVGRQITYPFVFERGRLKANNL